MKNKIFAILLLLSFLVVLSHEMIPHHHHHEYEADNVFDEQNLVGSFGEKSKEKSPREEHNHSFPHHHHISATSDFVSARTNLQESNPLNKISTLIMVSVVFQTDFFEPPQLSINHFRDKAFFITSAFYPAANALRGPPAIV